MTSSPADNPSAKNKTAPFTSPAVCDEFLPDLFFESTCHCVGRCTEDNGTNKINSFETLEGLSGCQKACQNETECFFFTLSKVDVRLRQTPVLSSIDVHECTLWRRCSSFEIPANSTYPYLEGFNIGGDVNQTYFNGSSVSLHWSGAKNCSNVKKTTCPLSNQAFGAYSVSKIIDKDHDNNNFLFLLQTDPEVSPWQFTEGVDPPIKQLGASTGPVTLTNKYYKYIGNHCWLFPLGSHGFALWKRLDFLEDIDVEWRSSRVGVTPLHWIWLIQIFLTNREKVTGSGHGFISTLQLCLQGEDNLNCCPKYIYVIIFCRIWTPRER